MIRIGPSGWTHPGLEPIWPPGRGRDFDPLEFLGRWFGCVEVIILEQANWPDRSLRQTLTSRSPD